MSTKYGWPHFAASLVLLTLGACTNDDSDPKKDPDENEDPQSDKTRVAVLGASMSVGYHGWAFGEAFVSSAPDANVKSVADLFMYEKPFTEAQNQVDRTVSFDPKLVLAIDFAFWPAYNGNTLEKRTENVNRVLTMLEALTDEDTTIVIGDIPRMAAAGNAPSESELAALRDTIELWAETQPNVIVVPLHDWAAQLFSTSPVSMPDGTTATSKELLFEDDLHPLPLGSWYVLANVDQILEQEVEWYKPEFAVFERPQ